MHKLFYVHYKKNIPHFLPVFWPQYFLHIIHIKHNTSLSKLTDGSNSLWLRWGGGGGGLTKDQHKAFRSRVQPIWQSHFYEVAKCLSKAKSNIPLSYFYYSVKNIQICIPHITRESFHHHKTKLYPPTNLNGMNVNYSIQCTLNN